MNDFFFDKSWTLFLDRDGVINKEKPMSYVNHWNEFIFYQKAEEAIALLSPLFYKTIVVTNQKGVGRGITPIDELHRIHTNMISAIEKAGGHIDKVYFCPDPEDNSSCRKPNPGMALEAKKDFSDIDLSKSIMIGNNMSDMHFGRNAYIGCNILLTTTNLLETVDNSLYDYHFPSLYEAAIFLKKKYQHK